MADDQLRKLVRAAVYSCTAAFLVVTEDPDPTKMRDALEDIAGELDRGLLAAGVDMKQIIQRHGERRN